MEQGSVSQQVAAASSVIAMHTYTHIVLFRGAAPGPAVFMCQRTFHKLQSTLDVIFVLGFIFSNTIICRCNL